MRATRAYGLVLGLSIAATVGVETAPIAARQASATASEETWTIPGAGSTEGLNNTRFVSDLALTNLGDAAANVTVSFVGPGGLPAKDVSLAAGQTIVYRDVLDSLWSKTGVVGALSVHSDQPLVLRARTYNTASTGTFGVALPVYASGQLLTPGQLADSFWVRQDASGTTGFRTNIGVVFPDGTGGDAVVTYFDAAGAVVGTQDYSSASAGFQQLGIGTIVPGGLLVGRAQISVTRGHAAGYAIDVDNVTGDTSLYPFEALPAGRQDVIVSGVARLNGANGTFFRTDARFYNPTPEDVLVTARFHAAGNANPSPTSATLTLSAGRVIEVEDVLDSILHLPVGSGGAVRFTTTRPVAILCRTSNVDPQGVEPGTFGAQQRPVPLDSFLSSADAGAVVTAIRQDSAFRTNIGFAAGPGGAAYRLTLKSAAGAVITTSTGSLGAFGWAQSSVASLFSGTAIPGDATLLVQVTDGTLDVYDASLDNASGDLVVTPIAPLPGAISSSALIGPAGGSVRSADGRLTLKVPARALAAPTTLSISPAANTAPQAIGSAYAIAPAGFVFAGPVRLVFAYTDDEIAGYGAGALGLASQQGSTWFAILGGSVDTAARTLSVPVTSTSPGAQHASTARGPLAVSQNGAIGPYGAVTLVPEKASVPVRGEKRFQLGFVGPPSTGSPVPGLVPLGTAPGPFGTSWYANGVELGNGSEGTIFGLPQNVGDYTAPACKPLLNPVRIAARVQVGTDPPIFAQARVRVIEKDWKYEVIYRSRSLCGSGPPPPAAFSVDFSRSHDGQFSFDPQGVVTDILTGLTHNNTTADSTWCIGHADCSQPTLSAIGDLNVALLSGSLSLTDTLDPFIVLTFKADVPGTGAKITFTCPPNGGAELPIIHGAPPQVTQPVGITYSIKTETLSFTVPSTEESVQVLLTPTNPCP